MKKLFSLMLLCVACICFCTACSDDDDEVEGISNQSIIGIWDVIWAEEDGETLDVPVGNIYVDFKTNGEYKVVMFKDHYTGTYRIEGNTVIGVTIDPITERFTFTKIEGKKAYIDYSNSEGLKMKFKVVKR